MKGLLLAAVYNALRAYAGAGLFDRIVDKVRYLITVPDLTGAAKMKFVLEFAQTELIGLGETLVRAIVEVYLLRNG